MALLFSTAMHLVTLATKGFTLAFPFSVSYQDFLISASSMPGVALPHLLITPLHAKEPSKDSMKF
jgi:hypothetical protein